MKSIKKGSSEKTINSKSKERKMSEKLEMKKGFVINHRDAVFERGMTKKGKAAVEGKAAIPEKKDKDGNIIQEAVAEVKAVAAIPEIAICEILSRSPEIAEEVRARMADQGYTDKYDGQLIEKKGKGFVLVYEAPTVPEIRKALKTVKAADGYNKEGLDKIKAEKKAEAKAAAEKAKEEKAAAEKAKEEKAAAEKAKEEKAAGAGADEKDAKPKKGKGKKEEPKKDEVEEGWPGEEGFEG